MNSYADRLRALQSLSTPMRPLIDSLIADRDNAAAILDGIARMLRSRSGVIYGPAPRGLQHNERERYREIIDTITGSQAAARTALGILGPARLLDTQERFLRIMDHSGMLERLGSWREHIRTMRDEALRVTAEFNGRRRSAPIRKVKIFGLGGSAAPHAIAAEIIGNLRRSSTEIQVVHADSPNADFVDRETLAVFASFSGSTEETIHCYSLLRERTSNRVALCKGGKLAQMAREDQVPTMLLPNDDTHPAYVLQPRESVCLQMTAMLTFLSGVGLAPGAAGSLTTDQFRPDEILPCVDQWRQRFGPQVSFGENPAKRLACFLLYGTVAGTGFLDIWHKRVPFIVVERNNRAVGHEARTQLHERSKVTAGFYEAPECLHNLVESIRAEAESGRAGIDDDRFVYYFIRSADEPTRMTLRLDATTELVMSGRSRYAVLNVEGGDPWQRALFATYFNAHMTTYMAILNGYDPLPVPTMSWMKEVMEGFTRGGAEERAACGVHRPLYSVHLPE
jgi:glucose/mannose-6-phosphate isomerase